MHRIVRVFPDGIQGDFLKKIPIPFFYFYNPALMAERVQEPKK